MCSDQKTASHAPHFLSFISFALPRSLLRQPRSPSLSFTRFFSFLLACLLTLFLLLSSSSLAFLSFQPVLKLTQALSLPLTLLPLFSFLVSPSRSHPLLAPLFSHLQLSLYATHSVSRLYLLLLGSRPLTHLFLSFYSIFFFYPVSRPPSAPTQSLLASPSLSLSPTIFPLFSLFFLLLNSLFLSFFVSSSRLPLSISLPFRTHPLSFFLCFVFLSHELFFLFTLLPHSCSYLLPHAYSLSFSLVFSLLKAPLSLCFSCSPLCVSHSLSFFGLSPDSITVWSFLYF